jgi:hypothetical protein
MDGFVASFDIVMQCVYVPFARARKDLFLDFGFLCQPFGFVVELFFFMPFG